MELLLEALAVEEDRENRELLLEGWRSMEAASNPTRRARLAKALRAELMAAIDFAAADVPDELLDDDVDVDDDDFGDYHPDGDWHYRFRAPMSPPPPPRGSPLSAPRGGARFGRTWWGKAWIEALEQRARLDPNRLPRGRSYAREGAVGELTIDPGEVRADVQGSRRTPYSVRLRVRQFTDSEWERILTAVASRASHSAALLDGELDPAIVEDMAGAGVALLPVAGEVQPTCSCPDWADPCKHSAAVCYLVADQLDQDPFTLLRLRGRNRDQVMAAVRRLRSTAGGGPAAAGRSAAAATLETPLDDPGIDARSLWRSPAPTEPPPLPSVPAPPARPGAPASLALDPPTDSPVRAEVLAQLAADAARRAFELSQGTGDGGLGLRVEEDLARIAAERLGQPGFDELAARSGMPPRTLLRLSLAWRAGGAAALEVLDGPAWYPAAAELDEGLSLMHEQFGQATLRGERVTSSTAGVQLRYGRDGLWYLAERRSGAWEITMCPSADPRELLARAAS